MKKIDLITRDNFDKMFNIRNILEESVYYPSSGIDGTAIEYLSDQFNSFVHADYSTSREIVKNAMENHFLGVGYDLIGIKFVEINELAPNGISPLNFTNNDHESNRLVSNSIKQKAQGRFIEPFACWAVFELNKDRTKFKKGKAKRFSILHLGVEACAIFEELYVNNNINPRAVAIISPAEGYGDNWTLFRDPEFRFYQNILLNHQINGAPLPSSLLTNMILSDDDACFWPDYHFKEKKFYGSDLRLYKHEQSFKKESSIV